MILFDGYLINISIIEEVSSIIGRSKTTIISLLNRLIDNNIRKQLK